MALEVPPPEAIPVVAAPESRTSGLISILLVVVSVGFAVAGQLTLKAAMDHIGRIGFEQVSEPLETVGRAAREPRLWAGLFLFGISSLFWLVVLSRVPLSVAYPFVGISYIFVVGFARFVLHENVPASRWVGVAVVALGIAIIGLSFRRVSGDAL
ncbi:MAG TPA: EamA family transporter [Actinomycetota bacterium]|nr:EamA family transporter [Actinomycetota bacterium]